MQRRSVTVTIMAGSPKNLLRGLFGHRSGHCRRQPASFAHVRMPGHDQIGAFLGAVLECIIPSRPPVGNWDTVTLHDGSHAATSVPDHHLLYGGCVGIKRNDNFVGLAQAGQRDMYRRFSHRYWLHALKLG
jgi:hypothetical protein